MMKFCLISFYDRKLYIDLEVNLFFRIVIQNFKQEEIIRTTHCKIQSYAGRLVEIETFKPFLHDVKKWPNIL